jgi:acetyltransferase-like isoleucine patch superfamily enzyme
MNLSIIRIFSIIKIYFFIYTNPRFNVHLSVRGINSNFIFLTNKKSNLIIEKNVSFRNNFSIKLNRNAKLSIAEGTFFNNNVSINTNLSITIGRNCLIGHNVVIIDHDHNYRNKDQSNELISSPIVIGNNVWIGANCVILRGVVIEDNVVIAAGTILPRGIYSSNSVFIPNQNLIRKNK